MTLLYGQVKEAAGRSADFALCHHPRVLVSGTGLAPAAKKRGGDGGRVWVWGDSRRRPEKSNEHRGEHRRPDCPRCERGVCRQLQRLHLQVSKLHSCFSLLVENRGIAITAPVARVGSPRALMQMRGPAGRPFYPCAAHGLHSPSCLQVGGWIREPPPFAPRGNPMGKGAGRSPIFGQSSLRPAHFWASPSKFFCQARPDHPA